ncbi:MAG: hypothetical protein RLY14_2479 [Planctomycetota bacterium]
MEWWRTNIQHRLALLLIAFWIGGVTAYAALVVPAGSSLLGAMDQGFVTRIVAWRFNLVGAVVMVPLLVGHGFTGPWRLRLSCWLMGVILVSLGICHAWLDGLLDAKNGVVLQEEGFYARHQIYLWLTTFQILLGWVMLWQLAGLGVGKEVRRETKKTKIIDN